MSEKSEEKKPSVHKGHRDRLRRKLLNFGADSLEMHELLELLLFSAIPRKNTNELAHELLIKFGSFSGVLEADFQELKTVKGIGEQAAASIMLANAINRMYYIDKYCVKNLKLTPHNVGEVITPLFYGANEEKLYIILLDSDFRMKGYHKIASGAKDHLSVDVRSITKYALLADATNVILAHNHPNGIHLPSKADIDVTKVVDRALAFVEIRLIDHIIVANNEAHSIFKAIKKLGYSDYK